LKNSKQSKYAHIRDIYFDHCWWTASGSLRRPKLFLCGRLGILPPELSINDWYSASQEIDWLIEQCFTSPPTQCRLSGRQFYRSKDPTNSIKVLKEKRYKSIKKTQKKQTTQIKQHN